MLLSFTGFALGLLGMAMPLGFSSKTLLIRRP
jgi:hypothetical protein